MKADLTRNTFNPFKHYARVLMQQGRVQLDADWNEQTAILFHYLQTLAADLIGPAGGPLADCGFAIGPLPPTAQSTPVLTDFAIGGGHYYVDGILCEVDSAEVGFVLVPPPSTTSSGVNTNPTTGTVPGTPTGSAGAGGSPGGAAGLVSSVIQVDTWSLNGVEFASNQYVEFLDDAPAGIAAHRSVVAQVTQADATKMQLTVLLPQAIDLNGLVNPRLRRVVTYLTQPDYPVPNAAALATGSNYQVYLDVWERHLTYVEDDTIREVALGGPDTATRSKIVWQVKTLPPPASTGPAPICTSAADLAFLLQPPTNGRLRARAKQTSASSDPCIIAPTSSYQGPENQLYRVEINRPGSTWNGTDLNLGSTAATFKWSRENSSVVFPIVSGGGTSVIALESLGRDDRFSLAPGDLVEVQDDTSVLLNLPGNLLTVQSIDRATATVTVTGTPDKITGSIPSLHPLLRRWDHKEGDPAEGGLTLGTDNAALIEENVWLALEDGVEVFFEPLDAPAANLLNAYRTSDYWLIPARTATGDVEWPRLTDPNGNLVMDSNGSPIPLAKSPDGIIHHYAPLAILDVVAGAELNPGECRLAFPPLARPIP